MKIKKFYLMTSPGWENIGGVMVYNKLLKEKIEELGYEVELIAGLSGSDADHCWGLSHSKGIKASISNVKKVKKNFRKLIDNSKDCCFLISSYYYCAGLKKSKDNLFVQIQHSNVNWITNYYKGNFIKKRLFRKRKLMDYFIHYPNCNELKKFYNLDDDRTFLVAPPYPKMTKLPKTEKAKDNVLWAGRLEQVDKDWKMIFKIAPLIDKQINIYGTGVPSEIEQIKELCKVHKNVKYHGAYKHKDLPKIHADHGCQIITSLNEGFPLMLMEACQNDTPVVMRNTFPVAQYFLDKEYAFEAKDENEFKTQIDKAINSKLDFKTINQYFESISIMNNVKNIVAELEKIKK